MKKVEDFKFSLTAFLFTFMYYYAKGDWFLGSVVLLTATLIPLKDYFLLGIVVGFVVANGYCNNKKPTFLKVLFACVSLLIFACLKYTELYWLGIM